MARVVFVLVVLAVCFVSPAAFGYSSDKTSTSVWDLQLAQAPITLDSNLMYVEGTGVRLKDSATSGEAGVYGVDAPFPTNWAVGSWNLDMPPGTGIKVYIRAVNGGTTTAWYEIARQGTTPGGGRVKSDSYGYIGDDTLFLYNTWPRIEYKIALYSDTAGVTPTLRLVSMCYADTNTHIAYIELPNPGVTTSLAVPWRSQYWVPKIGGVICGPTSMALAMAYNGCNLPTETVAAEAYDSYNSMYGNWPFLAQAAARHGFKSYYCRANGQQPIRDFIAQGVPVEIGMAYSAGELTNSPIPSTGGHLVMCVGVTADGHYICNDPAGSDSRWDHVVYNKNEIAHVWLERSGTMIPCIPNSVYWRFPYYSYQSTSPLCIKKNGIMNLFANGHDGQLYHMRQTSPNGGWTSWGPMGGGITASDPVAVSNESGGSSVFAKFADGNLYCRLEIGTSGLWRPWTNLGPVAGRPAVGKTPDGYLDVFCRMADGTIQHRWQRPSGWQAWAPLGSSTFPGDPVVGLNWDGRQEVFVRGADNQLYHCWQRNDGAFSDWVSLGGSIVGNPSIGRVSDGRLEVYCRFADGTVRHNWQNTLHVGTTWTGWTAYTGTAASDVVAARTPGFLQEIYCAGPDGTVKRAYQTSVDGGWSGWESLGGTGTGTPIVGHNEDGRLQLFILQDDGRMWSKWQLVAGGWSPWTAMGAAIFPETVPPVISSVTTTSPSLVAEGDLIPVVATVSDNVAVTEVTANGVALVSDGAGHWTGSVPAVASPGPNQITVTARDAQGNTSTDSSLTYWTGKVVATANRALVADVADIAKSSYLFTVFGMVTKISDHQFTLDDGSGNAIIVNCTNHGLESGVYAKARGMLSSGAIQALAEHVTRYD